MTHVEALALLIGAHRLARTNTPPDVLADHMLASLKTFEDTLLARHAHPFYAPGVEAGKPEVAQ